MAIQCAKYPERLIGFSGVNRLKDYAIQEIDRCYDELKLPGLKLHFSNSGVDLTIPENVEKTLELFSHCAEKGIPSCCTSEARIPNLGKETLRYSSTR